VTKAIKNMHKATTELKTAILFLDLNANMSSESENNPPTILSDIAIIEDKIIEAASFLFK
jgi:hypothetical protein